MPNTRRCRTSEHGAPVEGTFHQWGAALTYDEGNNPIPKTVAIIEKDNGQIIEVAPSTVRFLDV